MSETSLNTILAIDTSTRYLRLALMFDGDRTIKIGEDAEQSHGQMIMKKIGDLFASAGKTPRDLDAIAICTGPGSFTGLRIGIAAAKGMGVVTNVPMVGVTVFEAAAYLLREEPRPVEIITAVRRDEFIVGTVENGSWNESSVRVVAKGKLEAAIGEHAFAFVGLSGQMGTDAAMMKRNLSHRIDFDASHILQVGLAKLSAGKTNSLADLEPLYVQKSQAEIRFEQRHGQ